MRTRTSRESTKWLMEMRAFSQNCSPSWRAATTRLSLLELDSLGGYGPVSDALASYIDPIGKELTEAVNKIARLCSQVAMVN